MHINLFSFPIGLKHRSFLWWFENNNLFGFSTSKTKTILKSVNVTSLRNKLRFTVLQKLEENAQNYKMYESTNKYTRSAEIASKSNNTLAQHIPLNFRNFWQKNKKIRGGGLISSNRSSNVFYNDLYDTSFFIRRNFCGHKKSQIWHKPCCGFTMWSTNFCLGKSEKR